MSTNPTEQTNQPAPGYPTAPATPSAPSSGAAIGKRVGAAFGKRILVYGIGFVVLAGGGLAYKYFTGDPELAKAGNCVTDAPNANDMKTIGCGDGKAAFKVLARISGNYTTFSAEKACEAYPTATDYLFSTGSKGYVLCLEAITH